MIDDRFYTRTARTTLGEIIADLGADLSPSVQALTVSTISALETSTAGSLTYFGGRKYREQLIGASGSICICEPKDAQEVTDAGLTPVAAGYARAVFASAIDRAFDKTDFTSGDPAISSQASIDPTAKIMPGAVIGAGAVIAAGAVIGPNSVIYPGVSIGANSVIEANVTIQCAHVGMGCKIHSSASIGGDGFGVAASKDGTKDIPHIGRVIIGDNVSIGYGTMVDRGMLGDTVIKDGTKIDNLSQIAHNCVIGRNVMIAGHAGISGTVVVGDNVIMGGRVGIADHLTIGEGATLAASTSLMRDVPAGEVWAGFPAKPIRQYMREVATLSKLAKKPKKQ